MTARSLGGIAATDKVVIVSDRELDDTVDCFKCLDADTGKELWAVRYPAPGQLDYGNSSRATPLIHDKHVFLFGAFGHLNCVELATGKVVWDMDVRDEFGAKDERKWGMCSSPLLVDNKLIVNPGGKDAALVALEPSTSKVLWKTPGKPAGHGSFIVGTFGGVRQLVGHDVDSLGGWDVETGKRLWEVIPPRKNDFNVPTPIQIGAHLLVTTENNGTRLYRFKDRGVIDPRPVAVNEELAPDSHTPVVVGARVYGVWRGLHCLDLKKELKPIWKSLDEPAFRKYASLVASDNRVLLTSSEGELLLLDAGSDKLKLLGKLLVLNDEKGVYAHPAFCGTRIYLRGNSSIVCLDLKTAE